jgi:hypothetical protein
LVGEYEAIRMGNRFDDVEAHDRQIHTDLPDRQIFEGADVCHAPSDGKTHTDQKTLGIVGEGLGIRDWGLGMSKK